MNKRIKRRAKDIHHDKLEDRQQQMMKVKWGEKEIKNFRCLGLTFQEDGDHMSDDEKRISITHDIYYSL